MTFPLGESTGHNGMMISLPGVLLRAADRCEHSRDVKHLGFMLRELRKHIEQLRESESDEEAVRRLAGFLNVWTKT